MQPIIFVIVAFTHLNRATMKETILLLQAELKQEIDPISKTIAGPEEALKCYDIVSRYWHRAKSLVRQEGFRNDKDEIDFFKNWKAQFTGRLEYFLLIYRYQLFRAGGAIGLREFWLGQWERLRSFHVQHSTFIRYYEEGRSDWDDLYFLRRKFHKIQRRPYKVYDRTPELWTNGDWIVTLLTANRSFAEFLRSVGHTENSI